MERTIIRNINIMVFTEIDEVNKEEFSTVLPGELIDGLGISIGAAEDGEVYGAISLSYNGEEYIVDWLYVSPSVRYQGVGRALLQEAQSMVASIGLCPIRMQVTPSDDSGLYGFLLNIKDEDHPIDLTYSYDRYVITTEDFANSPAIKKIGDGPMLADYQTTLFWSLSEEERAEAFSLIFDNFSVFDEDKFRESCEKDLCLVEKKKNAIDSFMLVQREGDNDLKLTYIYSHQTKSLISLFQELSAMLEEYDTPQTVYFDTITKSSALLAKKLFPEAGRERIYEAEL